MDQGIIQSLKCHYMKKYVLDGLLPAKEDGKDVCRNVFDMIKTLKAAWAEVTPATIAYCFGHCGFKVTQPEENDEHEDPDDLFDLKK